MSGIRIIARIEPFLILAEGVQQRLTVTLKNK
jgi:hypothetical protein